MFWLRKNYRDVPEPRLASWAEDFRVFPEEREEIEAMLAQILPEPTEEATLRRIMAKSGLKRRVTNASCDRIAREQSVDSKSALRTAPKLKDDSSRFNSRGVRPSSPADPKSTWRQALACVCVGLASILCLNLPSLSGIHFDRNQGVSLGRSHW
jgi:hypothetical protein